MTRMNNIPDEFEQRLYFFEGEVRNCFSWLYEYGYILDTIETNRTENFLDYYSVLSYKNENTIIKIHYSTDIINGIKTAFPKLEKDQLPFVDNQISCSIRDNNALMSIASFVEAKFPNIPMENFIIKVDSGDIKEEITRVVYNYNDFFKIYLTDVLSKEKIYDCYIDRFYDKVFKEINYSKH
jgi:hypothetical protein